MSLSRTLFGFHLNSQSNPGRAHSTRRLYTVSKLKEADARSLGGTARIFRVAGSAISFLGLCKPACCWVHFPHFGNRNSIGSIGWRILIFWIHIFFLGVKVLFGLELAKGGRPDRECRAGCCSASGSKASKWRASTWEGVDWVVAQSP